VSVPAAAWRDPIFERPVIVVSPPRSGSTLLFEILQRAPAAYTIGAESHRLIESLPELQIGRHGFDSNRLTAVDATPGVIEVLRHRFAAHARDRHGRPPRARFRLVEKTPKNALRIPFLLQVFPEAHFLFLHRDPRQVMASMLDAWQSGRFRTYPQLPGWPGPTWSLVLTPGWRALAGKPLAQVVAAQWRSLVDTMLDDLALLPPERWSSVRYEDIVAAPDASIPALCARLGLGWDLPSGGALPLSRNTLTPPDADKWRRHAELLEPLLPALQPTFVRAESAAAR
jgi:hypothetical protein